MIQKIKKILEYALIFVFILSLPIEILYLAFDRIQLTSKSFDEILYLNSEISKLSVLENKQFKDREELFFNICNYVNPNIFDKYYFLNEYLFSYKYIEQYFPIFERIKQHKVNNSDLAKLSEINYFNRDSLISKIKLLINNDRLFFPSDYIESKSLTVFFVSNVSQLKLPLEMIKKLETIKDISYASNEEFAHSLQMTVGIKDYKQYSAFISGVKDLKAQWQKSMFYGFILLISILIIARIIIGFIISRNSEIKSDEEIEKNIDNAKMQISEKPDEIQPIWDLANYTLQKYYNKNLSQVNSIYKLSVVVMILGFALIVSILVSTVYSKVDVKLDSIGIIAGIITEFIGATFLFIYKSTVNQALHHSKSLEEINNVGMSIKIVESIEKDDKNKEKIDDAKIEIAKKLINYKTNI